jgi:hypothetical protein
MTLDEGNRFPGTHLRRRPLIQCASTGRASMVGRRQFRPTAFAVNTTEQESAFGALDSPRPEVYAAGRTRPPFRTDDRRSCVWLPGNNPFAFENLDHRGPILKPRLQAQAITDRFHLHRYPGRDEEPDQAFHGLRRQAVGNLAVVARGQAWLHFWRRLMLRRITVELVLEGTAAINAPGHVRLILLATVGTIAKVRLHHDCISSRRECPEKSVTHVADRSLALASSPIDRSVLRLTDLAPIVRPMEVAARCVDGPGLVKSGTGNGAPRYFGGTAVASSPPDTSLTTETLTPCAL